MSRDIALEIISDGHDETGGAGIGTASVKVCLESYQKVGSQTLIG